MMRNRIAFHRLYDFHDAMLKPLYAELKDEFDCLYSDSVDEVISFAPDILVLSDSHFFLFRASLPHTITVWTRHGLISKNYAAPSILQCDFACVSSVWVKDDFIRKGHCPRCGFWVTGFVPTDVIFNNPPLKTQPAWPQRLDPAKSTLLYAPTYNTSLGSVDILGEHWVDRILERHADITIIIKPHPHIPERQPEWMEKLTNIAGRFRNVHLIEDCHANIYELFSSVDILLTDASSTSFYFLLCNKPIILIDNSLRYSDGDYYDPEGIEWKWRDCGIVIENASQLPDALSACLLCPQEKQDRREHYRDLLFDEKTFGKATSNIAGRVRTLLKPPEELEELTESIWHMAAQVHEIQLKLDNGHSLSDLCVLSKNAMIAALKRRLNRHPHLKGFIKKVCGASIKNEKYCKK
jgi:teichoic acid glycerol-phosphate transferase